MSKKYKTYYGKEGYQYFVEEDYFAGGGEGSIHNVRYNELVVAKIFKEKKRTKKIEDKLILMVTNKYAENSKNQVTWPLDVIYDENGFAGYVMNRVKYSTTLNNIYSTGSNSYNLKYRLLAAINLCIVIRNVHNRNQVCGDLNPLNIVVNLNIEDKDAMHITLVDSDSFHIKSKSRTYRCEVGRGEYMAPELSLRMEDGYNLKSMALPTYTKETDLFTLAIHIFTLLMNGSHPFACSKKKDGKYINTMEQTNDKNIHESIVLPQPNENIKRGFFPFYHKKDGITIPAYAPKFQSLPSNIQALFVRAFVDGYDSPKLRPDTDEWIINLKKLINKMKQCDKNKEHLYFDNNEECPLCAANKRLKKILQMNKLSEKSFKLEDEDKYIKKKEHNKNYNNNHNNNHGYHSNHSPKKNNATNLKSQESFNNTESKKSSGRLSDESRSIIVFLLLVLLIFLLIILYDYYNNNAANESIETTTSNYTSYEASYKNKDSNDAKRLNGNNNDSKSGGTYEGFSDTEVENERQRIKNLIDAGKLKCINKKSGKNGIYYKQKYYLENGKLVFAYLYEHANGRIYDDGSSNDNLRFYFKNNTMIRMCIGEYPNQEVLNYSDYAGNQDTKWNEWEEKLLSLF